MLTIAYVFSALLVSALASPSPVDRDAGIRIGLTKRQDIVGDQIANIEALIQSLLMTRSKYQSTIATYRRNTGLEPPISIGDPIDIFPGSTFSNSTDANPTDEDTNAKRATGSDPLTNDNNVLWFGSISVGTPAVTYTVDFDTGSSDLFLPATTCTTNCKGHKMYNSTASSTSSDRKKTFKLAYGDGSSVSGEQYMDTVSAGGYTATGQALGAATTFSSGFSASNFPPDGLLGMGYQAISQYSSPPLVQTLIAQKKIPQPMFAFKLATSGSELFIGGVNTNLYTGAFTYAPVTTKAYWQVKMDSVSVNSKVVLNTISAIIDSGTTFIIGDSANVKKFYMSIPGYKDATSTVGAGFYTIPCSNIPTIYLSFGGKKFSIPPTVFNLGKVNARSSDCVGGIVASNQNFWIVGDLFMRNVYTSFDLGKNQVGFATLK